MRTQKRRQPVDPVNNSTYPHAARIFAGCGSSHIDSRANPVLDRCTVRCQASHLVHYSSDTHVLGGPVNLDLSCPLCEGIDMVQSVPAAMSEGTHSGYSTGVHSGVGIGSGGLVPAIGVSTHEFSHSSALARSLAWRPALATGGRHTLLGLVLSFFFVSAFALGCVATSIDPPDGDPIQILVSLIGLFVFPIVLSIPLFAIVAGAIKRARRAAKIAAGSPRARTVWQNAFYCHRCGTAFWPQPTFPEVPHRTALTLNQFRWHVWNAGGYANL
ncbi:hypothetical protein [Nocardia salmonicida]|uniref:hypothetical protein n=1 Tax=Nocardia salmonicida TaxID=53431 RepID=UPI0010427938|nr:hypothetical protein [Nocardia salmonicida]